VATSKTAPSIRSNLENSGLFQVQQPKAPLKLTSAIIQNFSFMSDTSLDIDH
jgi:hypothetical protein